MLAFVMRYGAVMLTANTLIVLLEYALGHITFSYFSIAGCAFVFSFYLLFITIPLISLLWLVVNEARAQ